MTTPRTPADAATLAHLDDCIARLERLVDDGQDDWVDRACLIGYRAERDRILARPPAPIGYAVVDMEVGGDVYITGVFGLNLADARARAAELAPHFPAVTVVALVPVSVEGP